MNKKILWIIIAVLLVAALAVAYFLTRPSGNDDLKDFTLVIVHKDGVEKKMEMRSDAEFLGPVLQEKGIIEGDMGDYGLYIKKVDGEKAIYEEDAAYWAFYVGDAYAPLGIDQTPIEAGVIYKLVYTADTYGG